MQLQTSKINCLCSLSKTWINQKPMDMATNLTKTHSIIKKSMLIATDFLWVGLSIPKTFNLHSMLPTLSFCAKPKAKSQNPHPKNNPRLSREAGPSQTMGGLGKSTFLYPSSALAGTFSPGRWFFTLREAVDSATPVKPFVQNDMREGWKMVTRI